MTYSEATLPCFLNLNQSKIPNANRGVFSGNLKIPAGFIFGPYAVLQFRLNLYHY